MLDLLAEIGQLGCKQIETPVEHNHKLGESIEDVELRIWIDNLIKGWSET